LSILRFHNPGSSYTRLAEEYSAGWSSLAVTSWKACDPLTAGAKAGRNVPRGTFSEA